MIAILALLVMTPTESAASLWTLAGFFALVAMHAAYWVFTHPVNKFWLKDQDLKSFGAGNFGFDPMRRSAPEDNVGDDAWQSFRDRWGYSTSCARRSRRLP